MQTKFEPRFEVKVNDTVKGILTRIAGFEFTQDNRREFGVKKRDTAKTTFSIKNSEGLERTLEFNCFVGCELIGQEVQYDDITTTSTSLQDISPPHSTLVTETKRICKLSPSDSNLPSYTFTEVSNDLQKLNRY